uniref:Uncharacterized protein n=1 Tax=Ditylenchus dipsaci TaxID=166011 RepID=A0A915DC02_9BILA
MIWNSMVKKRARKTGKRRKSKISPSWKFQSRVSDRSKPLAMLQLENDLLLSRLVEPKSKKATPRNPLHKLGRVASLPKISQIVSL